MDEELWWEKEISKEDQKENERSSKDPWRNAGNNGSARDSQNRNDAKDNMTKDQK